MTRDDKGQNERFSTPTTFNRVALALSSLALGGWVGFLAVLATRH